jgi:hypothetical protein
MRLMRSRLQHELHNRQSSRPARLLVLTLLTLIPPVHGRTYYVSSTQGSDANAGVADAPWKTVARVNQQLLNAGDIVLFRRGDIWSETLKPRSSGRPRLPIVFSAYASGPLPILQGSLTPGADVNIENNEQSYIIYRDLQLRGGRQGLRLYAWRVNVRGILLENSEIRTEATAHAGTMSAGVYASVGSGTISDLVIRHNEFHPYPTGLENWGVYFVKGVVDFRIEHNFFTPAGEDAICIWHSAKGLITQNTGGGNGENTIDVKDSREIVIGNNVADRDGEYNIVVHRVEPGSPTEQIVVTRNKCQRGGQGGQLTAGIALLFVQDTKVTGNVVENPSGVGIYVRDANHTPETP